MKSLRYLVMITMALVLFTAATASSQDVSTLSFGGLGSDPSSHANLSSGSRKGSASEGHTSAAEQSIEGTPSISTNTGSVVPVPPQRKWGLEIYAEDYYEVAAANHETGKMETAAFVGLTYVFSPNLSGYVRQNFAASLDMTAKDQRGATSGDDERFSDTELGLATKNLAKWNGGSLNVTHRLYLPTGKYSIAGGEITYLREIVIASETLNRSFETGFAGDFRGAVYARNGYVDKFGTLKENRNVLMNPAVYLTAKANSKISASVYAGTLDVLKHSYNGAAGTHISTTYLDTSVSAQVTERVALTLGAENDMNIGKDQIGHSRLYRDSETQYYLNVYSTL